MAKDRFSTRNSDIGDAADTPAQETAAETVPTETAPADTPAASDVLTQEGDLFGKFSTSARKKINEAIAAVDAEAAKAVAEKREVVIAVTIRRTRQGALSAVVAGAGVAPVTIAAE